MREKLFKKINSFTLIGIAFFMPLLKVALPILILIWGLNWLFLHPPLEKWQNVRKNVWALVLFTALFFIYLLSMSYTDNTGAGWFDIESKLFLMLAPLILFTGAYPGSKTLKRVFTAFVLGSFLSVIIVFIHAFFMFFENNDISVFSYTGFSYLMHPTYFALYLNFAVVLLFYYLFSANKISIFYKITSAALIVFFTLGIVLAGSKAVIITLFVTLCSALVFYLSRKKYFRLALLGLLLFVITAFVIGYNIPALNNRITESGKTLFQYLNNEKLCDLDGTSQRILAWQCTVKLIGQSPFTGVGAGDVKDVLIKEYYANEYYYLAEKKLNPHNQFLQTFLATGIAGFLSLFLLFLIPVLRGVRQRHFVYVNFLLIVFINILTESLLEKQAGIIFFAFFNSLLFCLTSPMSEEQ